MNNTSGLVVFPAYVGMSPNDLIKLGADLGVPRIRGDEPRLLLQLLIAEECSPHTWG